MTDGIQPFYQIHLYVPKTGKLTPSMLAWLYGDSQHVTAPEKFWPVRKLKPKALARLLLRLDPTLVPSQGEDSAVLLQYSHPELNISLYLHDRGVIIAFPLVGSLLARIVLGISYTYIRFLYDSVGFWSYDPQLKIVSYADDYQSIDETARLMDELLPRLLS